MSNNHQITVNSRALEMFQSGQGADCVLEVLQQIDGQQDPEKKEFNVHKYVLMVNSEVFMAMFSHANTKEVREGRIQITDSTPTAVRQMLVYIYTGERPTEYAIETDAGPLLHIAHKYHIQSLVQLIEQELINSLSLENVLDRVGMADLYQIKSLYSACGQLIQRNLKMVKKEAKWLELKKRAPQLAIAILEEFVDESGSGNDVQIPPPINFMSLPPTSSRQPWNPVSRPRAGPNRHCYNCGENGHISRECPYNNAPRNVGPNCYNCGEWGHVFRNCPSYNDPWGPNNEDW